MHAAMDFVRFQQMQYDSDNHALSYVNKIIHICDSKGPVSVMICIY